MYISDFLTLSDCGMSAPSEGMAAAAPGHLALPIMLGVLCEEGEAQLLGEARKLYEQHDRDAGDTILVAFRAENWTKVPFP